VSIGDLTVENAVLLSDA